MMEKRRVTDKWYITVLLVGLGVGMVTGLALGINIASWNFAGVIAKHYGEVIRSGGALFVNINDNLYELSPVKSNKNNDTSDPEKKVTQ